MLAIVLGIGAGSLAAGGLYRLFFADSDDFFECLGYLFQPDWYSLIQGTWFEDQWKSWKVRGWILLSGAVGFVVYALVNGGV